MGLFIYDDIVRIDIDDRPLAHLQAVVGAKLRRGEAFWFTWSNDAADGSGRTTVWMHPNASLVFRFHGGRRPAVNRAWIAALSEIANRPFGLHLVPEPAEGAAADPVLEG